MKRIVILVTLMIIAITSCSYLDEAREEMNERRVECRYNKRKEIKNYRYIN